jgi:hypothetical protein
LRQVLEEGRLRAAGRTPVGVKHDSNWLTRRSGGIELSLVKR